MQIFLGLVLIAIGTLIVIGTESVLRLFGGLDFAEKYFRLWGGSRSFYKFTGIVFIFVGFVIMFNLHVGFMQWIAKTFFGAYAPQNGPVEEYRVIQ